MDEIDRWTAGRLEEKTCDEIEEMVNVNKKMTFVYFGPHRYLLKGAQFSHIYKHVYEDRRMLWEEPIFYVYNED